MDLVLPRMLELNTIQADDAAGLMMSVLQVLINLQHLYEVSISAPFDRSFFFYG